MWKKLGWCARRLLNVNFVYFKSVVIEIRLQILLADGWFLFTNNSIEIANERKCWKFWIFLLPQGILEFFHTQLNFEIFRLIIHWMCIYKDANWNISIVWHLNKLILFGNKPHIYLWESLTKRRTFSIMTSFHWLSFPRKYQTSIPRE